MVGGEGAALVPALPPHAEAWLDKIMGAPDGLREVVNRLFTLGSRVWLVGGCVRDVLADRGRAPHDVDLAVDVEPAVMLEGFGCRFLRQAPICSLISLFHSVYCVKYNVLVW